MTTGRLTQNQDELQAILDAEGAENADAINGVKYLLGDETTNGSWKLAYNSTTGGMEVLNRQAGAWIAKTDWQASLATDKLILTEVDSTLSFVGLAGEQRNLIRPAYTDSKGFVLGNTGGKGIIYTDGSDILLKHPDGGSSDSTIHDGIVEHNFVAYEHTEEDSLIYANQVFCFHSIYPKTAPAGTRMRLVITHQSSGNVVHESCPHYTFENFGAGFPITAGIENTYPYDPEVSLIKGHIYGFSMEFSEDVTMYGDVTSIKQKFTTKNVHVDTVVTFTKFDTADTYNTDDTVWYLGNAWTCLNDAVTGSWVSTDWSKGLSANTPDQIISPDAGTYAIAADTGVSIHRGNDQLAQFKTTGVTFWSSNGDTRLKISNSELEGKFNNVVRSLIDATSTTLNSPDTLQSLVLANTGLTLNTNKVLTELDKGATAGVAELVGGLVPEAQLPAYVDDVLEKYLDVGDTKSNGYDAFYDEITLITKVTESAGVIYVDVNTSSAYRWTGSVNAMIGTGLVLGELSSNAYRGDRGKTAYDHSLLANGHAGLLSPDTLKTLAVSDSNLSYHNGSVQTLLFDSTGSKILSPAGTYYIRATDSGVQVFDATRARIVVGAVDTVLDSPDGLHDLTINNSGAFYDGVEIGTGAGGSSDTLTSPDTLSTAVILNTAFTYTDAFAAPRIRADATTSILTSPNWAQMFSADNTKIEMKYLSTARVVADATTTTLKSPDGLQTITVDNTGAYFNGNAIEAPLLLTKIVTGTMSASNGGQVQILHGVDPAKIRSVSAVCNPSAGVYVPQNFRSVADREFDLWWGATNVNVINTTNACADLYSKPVKLLITYEA